MAGRFIQRAISKIGKIFDGLVSRQQVQGSQSSPAKASTKQKGSFSASTQTQGLNKAIATVEAISNISTNSDIPQEMLTSFAEEAREAVRDEVSEISRTGELRDSFQVRQRSGSQVDLVTTSEYEGVIREGWKKPPPPAKLMEWMKRKPEFAGYSAKEQKQIAFAIYYSFRRGANEGGSGKSDIRQLRPYGERRFDTVEEAVDSAELSLSHLGVIMRKMLGT